MATTGMPIIMTDTLSTPALLRLAAWMSPAFPIGAFAYSHGIERAVHDGDIAGRADLRNWLADLLTIGSMWNDAVLFAESWRRAGNGETLDEVAELGEAMAGAAERHLETMRQGSAFLAAARAWDTSGVALPAEAPLPVAAGAVAGAHAIPPEAALAVYLQAFVTNLTQAGLRLLAFGQQDGVAIVAGLEDTIADTARRAAGSSLDDLGAATIRAEIAALTHETQYSRLFRS